MEIAQTILAQLKAVGQVKLWSWGSRNFYVIKESKQFAGGLGFKVNGLKHKGWVTIKLRCDLYTISFINKIGQTVKTVDGCYFDQIVDVIDNFVEFTGANYANDVKQAIYSL